MSDRERQQAIADLYRLVGISEEEAEAELSIVQTLMDVADQLHMFATMIREHLGDPTNGLPSPSRMEALALRTYAPIYQIRKESR